MAERYRFNHLPVRAYEAGWTWRLQVNTQPGWRGWLATRLRLLAQHIDGSTTLGITIQSDPPLSPRRERQALACGLEAMERAVASEVRDAAIERALIRTYPELQPHGQD